MPLEKQLIDNYWQKTLNEIYSNLFDESAQMILGFLLDIRLRQSESQVSKVLKL